MFEAEAMGVREALSWAVVRPSQKIIIESDSLLSSVENECVNQLEVGHVLECCKLSLQSNDGIYVSFIRKHASKVAHKLVRISCLVNCHNVFSSSPSILLETILYDTINY